ncbi:MAG TPA: hypothetical protein PK747_11025 [Acidobacteriota bacterium]|nr:hypothetical protein [Acidobacteriota bacterium]HQQ47922.1 hypothetical protein [Acidobacteriota bacterium]
MKRGIVFLSALLVGAIGIDVSSREPLTFQERVKAQEAIERVYYSHRIWPKENPGPKPPFEKMVPKESIEAKVTDYLKKCAALDQFWQRPIIASQLQAEMDRMAKGSKDPATLNELFAALQNDPYLIAECLARPVLADRLCNTIIAKTGKKRVLSKKIESSCMEEWIEVTSNNAPSARWGHSAVWTGVEMIIWGGIDGSIDYNDGGKYVPATDSWNYISTDVNCPSARHGHTAVWTGSEMLIWGGHNNVQEFPIMGGKFNPFTDSWSSTSIDSNCPVGRSSHTAIWTGTEMIVWGGSYDDGSWHYLRSGGRYNPDDDAWLPTSIDGNCPSARVEHTAVWTGTEMIIWGGGYQENTGARYNPINDSWITMSTGTNCPTQRYRHTAIWTGSEMIVWGGYDESNFLNSGGRYFPSTDSWLPTSIIGENPSPRFFHTAIWTGNEMIIWGGSGPIIFLNSGGRYNPATDMWVGTSQTNSPSGRDSHSAVWDGSQMIIWGGISDSLTVDSGGRYYIPYSPSGLDNNTAYDKSPCDHSGITVTWNADPNNWGDHGSGTRFYDVIRDGSVIASQLPYGTAEYTDLTGQVELMHLYKVIYYNGCGLNKETAGQYATDLDCRLTAPAITSITDDDPCLQTGITITFSESGGVECSWGSPHYDLYRDSAVMESNISNPCHYNPGDTLSHLYIIRAHDMQCYTDSAANSLADLESFVPDEVANFNDVFSWDPVTGSDGYRLYRGTFPDLPNLKTSTADGCLRYEGAATSFDCSVDDPGSVTGGLYWYLVTAYAGACVGTAGEGTGFTRNLSSSANCP